MANPPIDALLQLTVPSRAPIDLAPLSTSQAAPFGEHFNRAALGTTPPVHSRPESDQSYQDDTLIADQYAADSNSSLPDDSHFQPDTQGDSPAKTANDESTRESQEELPTTEDVVEISSDGATQTVVEKISEANDQLPQVDREESAEKDSAHATSESTKTTDDTVNRSSPQAVSHDEGSELPETSPQPDPELLSNSEASLDPELAVELNANATRQQAKLIHAQSTNSVEAEVQQVTKQDALAEQPEHKTDSSHQADLHSSQDFNSEEQSVPSSADGLTKHLRQTTTDTDTSDKSPSSERQVPAMAKPIAGVEVEPALSPPLDTESVSASKPIPMTDAPTPPTTNNVPPTEAVDRSLDRLALPRSIQPAGPTSEQTDTATVDRARFVGRVSSALRLAQQRDGRMQLRLSPPELGSLRLEISVKHGVLTATLETETAAARQILLENLPALRERLAGQEIRIEQFDVDVRREGGEQAQNRAAQERPGDQTEGRQNFSERRTDQRERTANSTQALATQATQLDPDGLDVVI